jgi:hypothetical protein
MCYIHLFIYIYIFIFIYSMWDFVISIVTRLRNGSQGFECRQSQEISFYSKTSIPALFPPNLQLNVFGTFYTETLKRPGRDANHSHPASAKVQNDGKYTSIPLFTIVACTRTTYPLHMFISVL